MKVRPGLTAASVFLTLTACGSTVEQRSLVATQPGNSQLGGTAGAQSSGGSTSTSNTTGSNVGAATGSSSGSTGVGGSTGAGTPGPQASRLGSPLPRGRGAPVGTAPGVTATTIKIGVYTLNAFGKYASQFGAGIATGNHTAQARAVIDYLNAHGGLAGRKIIPVFHDFDITAGQTTGLDTEYQRACSAWTQDDRVYAVVTPVGTASEVLTECLSKAGVPTIGANDPKDAPFFQKYADWFYEPSDINLRRIFINEVEGLVSAGFFGARPKIGVVLSDVPGEHAAVDKGLRPALARNGLSLSETFAAPMDNSSPAAYQNAVLKFRTQGITHVLFTSSGSPLLFSQDAESQQYYPRYALHSKNSPSTLQGLMSSTSQHGAMGIGWEPMNDVDAERDPGSISSRQALCLRLMREAQQDTSARPTAVFALWYCDTLFFLRDALSKAPSFSAAGLRQGAETLADFEAASTFRSQLAPGRLHDGASAYRVLAFKDGCKCYQYMSPLRPTS